MGKDWRVRWDKDRYLLHQAAKNDPLAFEKLYKKYYPQVLHYLRGINGQCRNPEEVAHETLLRFWKARAYFHAKNSVRPFVFAIAKHVLREAQRTSFYAISPEAKRPNQIRPSLRKEDKDPTLSKRDARIASEINEAVAQLPPEQAEAIRLVYVENLSHKAAAHQTGCSLETLRERIRQARRHLCQTLKFSSL